MCSIIYDYMHAHDLYFRLQHNDIAWAGYGCHRNAEIAAPVGHVLYKLQMGRYTPRKDLELGGRERVYRAHGLIRRSEDC